MKTINTTCWKQNKGGTLEQLLREQSPKQMREQMSAPLPQDEPMECETGSMRWVNKTQRANVPMSKTQLAPVDYQTV